MALLLWAWPAQAGQKQAVEAHAYYLPGGSMGEWSPRPSGMTRITDYIAVCKMVSGNLLVNGLLVWQGNFTMDAQGNFVGSGAGVFKVGTWDGNGDFIPSGGQWVTKWEGQGNFFGPYAVKVMGHGVAGEVEGMQFNLTAQWAAPGEDYYSGQLLDPHATK